MANGCIMTDVTQPPEDQQWQQPPVPQPFTMPSPPPAGDPGPPAGAAPGQAYGAYQAHPGSSYGTPSGGTPGQPAPSYGTGGRLARDPALAEWWQRLLARLVDDIILISSPARSGSSACSRCSAASSAWPASTRT